ncbi:DUF6377 domain-containing protein [Bacteroides propionicifaciens]|uniref:DUF6377 domain-containing protein n=1 Tax=Bacteroides propionicifaciens TaxID=392838 RepID=UPI000375619C|nr:DUF6377 domain-containing protein [Bacteroides propionicifaciens]
MKTLLIIAFVFLFPLNVFSEVEQDTIQAELRKLLENKDVYTQIKEQRISELKTMLETPNISDDQTYDVNLKLYHEYKTYLSDSAIHFLKKNLEIAKHLDKKVWINEAKLHLSALYSVAGMYIDSYNMLENINKDQLPDWLLINYYDSYKQLYSNYSVNNIEAVTYKQKSDIYRDSLLSVLDQNSNHYKIVLAEKYHDQNRLEDAKKILHELLEKSPSENHERAVLAYALANIFKKEQNIEQEKEYYTISAICDIKNGIKENASLQALASVLYETGDIELAYKCIQSSMEDAMFCNARLRTFEVSQIFPIIDSAYQDKIMKQKNELKLFLLMISILSVFLIIAIIYVYYQMKRLARIRKELYKTNTKLNELNTNLQSSNSLLLTVNTELSDANRIKETYIGHFLDLCSTYISKLEKYQNTLNKKAVEKKLDELYKMLKSSEMIDNELKELYENFDNIFLHLYPNFVEELNSLLVEEERFELKQNELLNTELRIFALIRLGITDSSKIASFLHYSANTIYNYRTRVRNKAAVPREEFESLVIKIGAI